MAGGYAFPYGLAMQIARLEAATHDKLRAFEVAPGDVVTLGRSSQCTVPISDAKVSRKHCLLRMFGSELLVEDLGSGNGVRIQGEPAAHATLRPGDEFQIGYTVVRFLGWRTAAAAVSADAVGGTTAEPETDDDFAIRAAADEDPFADPAWEITRPAAAEPVGVAQYPPVSSPQSPRSYPAVDSPRARPEMVRRPVSPQKQLAARLLAEFLVFSMIWGVGIFLLLVLKMISPDWDIYRLLGFLRSARE
jgi:pSer/pThr/pTyr-binding forkhead associated (FHA) protein